ncbi:MAG: glycosyltransferase family 2 protein [Pseudomonadota bacterium]|nr:glycosyltransferase family 2 protein [Pseudomonadota bacterium]
MKPEISVCVCAYRRPDDLRRLLESLVTQVPSTPAYEVVVVDNDAGETSAAVAGEFANARIPVRYFVEPEQNIARARNRSLAEAKADLIAIIDDDEVAEPDWLLELQRELLAHAADAAFGPVHSRFVEPPPQWIIDGGFFDYSPIPTGQTMPLESTRTSNVLLRRSALPVAGDAFDEKLGLTGGSDTDLFRRMQERNAHLIAVESAVVHETVPAKRACLKWLAARWFRYGTQRLAVLENRRGSFRHDIVTAGRGFLVNLWRAVRVVCRDRGYSALQIVHVSYWAGVLASLFGYRHKEYK